MNLRKIYPIEHTEIRCPNVPNSVALRIENTWVSAHTGAAEFEV